jgi:LytS/YehU family sensor histidine kinase
MNRKIPFKYHLLLFLAVYLIFTLWDIGVKGEDINSVIETYSILLGISHLIAVFLIYLLNFYVLCPWLLQKKIGFYVLTIPFSLVLFAGVRYVLQEVIVYELTGIHNYFETSRLFAYYLKDNFFFGLPSVILSAGMYIIWQLYNYRRRAQQLLIENKKAEFQLLKSQVSPHFLFNTLNSFYSELVEKDEKLADDLLVLSDLLRYVITENDKEMVLLSDDIDFIKNYIALQQRRFENEMYLEFTINGNYTHQSILPSVLIHFTENVFKHGVLNRPDKKASITITITNDRLEVSTFNYIQQGENYYSTGIGYKNLTDRLNFAYGNNYILEKNSKNDTFITYLNIPLK